MILEIKAGEEISITTPSGRTILVTVMDKKETVSINRVDGYGRVSVTLNANEIVGAQVGE